MRRHLLASAVALFALPAAAPAQEQARSPAEFVCALTGDCATTAPAEPAARVAPSTRAFVLAKPPRDTERATATASRQPAAPAVATAARAPRAPAGSGLTAQPRVDLRLGFATGTAVLLGRELEEVRNFAAALKSDQLAGRRIRIEGHTDSIGSRASNLGLSQRRAKSVADTLVAEGIDPARLEIVGYGFDRPLPGHPARSASNRRVEAVLTD